MHSKELNDFFSKHLKDVKFDLNLIKKIHKFRLEWSTKSPDYIDFLGSGLFGTHIIRFSSIDDEKLMGDIFHIEDIDTLQKEFWKLDGIDKKLKVGSNVIYHTLTYAAYKFLHNGTLKKDNKNKGIIECGLILQYKMFTSLYSTWLTHPVREDLAVTVYERLSKKFILKQEGTWQKVFLKRAEGIIDKKSVNYRKLNEYTTIDAIRFITDIQTKIRSNLIELMSVLMDVKDNHDIIKRESATFSGGEDNDKQIRVKESAPNSYIHNITSILYNEHEFIDEHIIKIISALSNKIDDNLFKELLKIMTDIDIHKDDEKIEKRYFKYIYADGKLYNNIIKDIISVNLTYLQRKGTNIEQRENIVNVIIDIRNFWANSKVNDERVVVIKRYINIFLKKNSKIRTKWKLSLYTISIIVYIFLRSIRK